MADENYPRDVDDDIDPADVAFVQSQLSGLAFLNPGSTAPLEPVEPMPDWAWERISAAMAAQAVVEPAGGPPTSARASRTARWGGGLVAASVAIVAIGLGVSVVRGGSGADVAVVAGGAPATSAVTSQKLAEAAPAPSNAAGLTAEDLEAPNEFSFAGIAPAQMLVDSDTDYTAAGLRRQVRSVLSEFGISNEQQATAVMTEPPATEVVETLAVPPSGFTTDEQSLRDCITKLTKLAEATALLVDRSTFEGSDAGVVVAPEYVDAAAPRPDMSRLRVWVVDPDCDITMEIRIRMRP